MRPWRWATPPLGVEQWQQARDAYRQALEIAERTKLKDAARIAAVREAAAGAALMLARELFEQGKLNECIEMTGTIVFEDPQRKIVRKPSVAAAQASALAVSAALNLYDDAPEDKKPAALERLMELAKFTETNWPDLPEADDARIARGQAKLVVGQVRQAIDIFERVNPRSERYPLAMYSAGAELRESVPHGEVEARAAPATPSRWPPTGPRRSSGSPPVWKTCRNSSSRASRRRDISSKCNSSWRNSAWRGTR